MVMMVVLKAKEDAGERIEALKIMCCPWQEWHGNVWVQNLDRLWALPLFLPTRTR